MRTFPPLPFRVFADAALFRICGNAIAAAQRMSPERMKWMAPAPPGVAMRHNAGVKICF